MLPGFSQPLQPGKFSRGDKAQDASPGLRTAAPLATDAALPMLRGDSDLRIDVLARLTNASGNFENSLPQRLGVLYSLASSGRAAFQPS